VTIGAFGAPFGGGVIEQQSDGVVPLLRSFEELKAAIEAVPATVNPVLLIQAVQSELQHYSPRFPDDDSEIIEMWKEAQQPGRGFMVGRRIATRATEAEVLAMARDHREERNYLCDALVKLEARFSAAASVTNQEDWRARLRRCTADDAPVQGDVRMSFGATFEPLDEVEQDPEAPQADYYLLRRRRQNFEIFRSQFEAGDRTQQLPPRLVEIFLEGIANGTFVATDEQLVWLEATAAENTGAIASILSGRYPRAGNDPFLDAYAASKAHAAARTASPRTHINVVITLADAARVFAYRGLHTLADKIRAFADRFTPDR
jgi:hypothetical protein